MMNIVVDTNGACGFRRNQKICDNVPVPEALSVCEFLDNVFY